MIKWAVLCLFISVPAAIFGFGGVTSGPRLVARWVFGIALVASFVVFVLGVARGELSF